MSKKHEVIIDNSLCIGCGMCANDCVAGAITLVEGKAQVNEAGCIACGHCEAVCPKHAAKLAGFEEDTVEIEQQTRLAPEELLKAIKTRRSIRNFRTDAVPEEILADIIEAGRQAPTGGNAQNTGYIVLGSQQRALEDIAVGMFRKLVSVGKIAYKFLANMNIDDNFFFKKAPLVISITGNPVNASLAAQNMAFMAEAHGLGVLYSGFYTTCVNHNRKLRKLMKMERKEKVVTTLVIGYTDVKYHRTVKREKAKLRIL